MGISFSKGEAEFNSKGVIEVGTQEKKGFKIKFEVKTICQDKKIISSRIVFIPDSDSMGDHEIASSVLYSEILDKLREILPLVISGARIIEKEELPTFELIGAEPFSEKDLTYYITNFFDDLKKKLEQIQIRMEKEFHVYPPPTSEL